VVTPSHNPPEDGGFNTIRRRAAPADTEATMDPGSRQRPARRSLEEVKRVPLARARRASTTHDHDYWDRTSAISEAWWISSRCAALVRAGVDPLGGAGVHYWARRRAYRLPLTVVSTEVDPTFHFMTVDGTARSAWTARRLTRCSG